MHRDDNDETRKKKAVEFPAPLGSEMPPLLGMPAKEPAGSPAVPSPLPNGGPLRGGTAGEAAPRHAAPHYRRARRKEAVVSPADVLLYLIWHPDREGFGMYSPKEMGKWFAGWKFTKRPVLPWLLRQRLDWLHERRFVQRPDCRTSQREFASNGYYRIVIADDLEIKYEGSRRSFLVPGFGCDTTLPEELLRAIHGDDPDMPEII